VPPVSRRTVMRPGPGPSMLMLWVRSGNAPVRLIVDRDLEGDGIPVAGLGDAVAQISLIASVREETHSAIRQEGAVFKDFQPRWKERPPFLRNKVDIGVPQDLGSGMDKVCRA